MDDLDTTLTHALDELDRMIIRAWQQGQPKKTVDALQIVRWIVFHRQKRLHQ